MTQVEEANVFLSEFAPSRLEAHGAVVKVTSDHPLEAVLTYADGTTGTVYGLFATRILKADKL